MASKPSALDLADAAPAQSNLIPESTPGVEMQMDENTLCPGCKRSVVDETGGVVVAFGQSFFHVDCFKCAKCRNQVTADTNLLLLSDGSPICSNCSYSCNVCRQPILDEAIMTGDDSYHAHCFKCKVCKNRIEELVFAKTSQGIYCMDCHNARVAKSRRHAQRQKEKQEAAARAAASEMPNSPSIGVSPATNGTSSPFNSFSSRSGETTNGRSSRDLAPPSASSTLSAASAPTSAASKRRSALPTEAMMKLGSQLSNGSSQQSIPSISAPSIGQSVSSASNTSATSSPALEPSYLAEMSASSGSTPYASARSSLALKVDAPPVAKAESSPPALAIPASVVDKRKSFDDGVRPLNVLFGGSPTRREPPRRPSSPAVLESAPDEGGLLVPEPSARARKRQSIDPGLALGSFLLHAGADDGDAAQGPSPPKSPRSPSGSPATVVPAERLHVQSRSPRADVFPGPSAPPLARDSGSVDGASVYHSPPASPREPSPGATARLRAGSAGQAQERVLGPRPPLRSNFSLDRAPTLERVPPRNTSLGYSSRLARQASMGASVERTRAESERPRADVRAEGERTRSQTERVRMGSPTDVPHGIESGTDTDGRGDESADEPPTPPPKTQNQSTDDEAERAGSPDDGGGGDGAGEPVRTSHATFIAPALPPIRFSMSADLSDLLKSVNGAPVRSSLDQLVRIAEREGAPADESAPPLTPTSAESSASHTPTTALTTPSASEEDADRTVLHTGSPESVSETPTPTFDLGFKARSKSSPGAPQLLVNGHARRPSEDVSMARAEPRSTLAAPDIGAARPTKSDPKSEHVLRRVLAVLEDATSRQAPLVKIDLEFVKAIADVLERTHREMAQLRSKVDGAKRTSQQYIDGLTVAQTEYDSELKARRDAEAEVSRLRVLLSGQTARLSAMSNVTRKQELQEQMSQEMTNNLSELERETSKLKVERDMTRAEVETLCSGKSEGTITESTSSSSLTSRFDHLKSQYQGELEGLVQGKEALLREIAELKQNRDIFLEETTALSARNEELAKLGAEYARRADASSPPQAFQPRVVEGKRSGSFDRQRQQQFASQSTSSLAPTDESAGTGSPYVRIVRPDGADATPVAKKVFKWGSKAPREPALVISQPLGPAPPLPVESKVRVEHTFQQLAVLRFTRCDHCGDKMWGSQYRCTGCNISIHSRCLNVVDKLCASQSTADEPTAQVNPLPPSMFGRDLIDQARADAKGSDREVPVIVEKCIDAVETHALEYEGIYRKTGGTGQSKTITQLFERGEYDAFDLRDNDKFNDICSITSVLKNYFRALPDPLLTYALHERFMDAAHTRDPAAKTDAMRELVLELPPEHYATLRLLMIHLHHVCERSEINLMSARNLGVVFGPTLLRSQDPTKEFSDMAGKALSVEWLIEQAEAIFDA